MNTLPEFTEFESKYRIDSTLVNNFKMIMQHSQGLKAFKFVEGPDYYYTKDGEFARYRKPANNTDGGRAEVTWKQKPKNAKNNIIRKEVNWRVDGTPEDTIKEGLEHMGYKLNFKIWKSCHIYEFEDASVSFYTVTDITDLNPSKCKSQSFIEIEVKEDLIHTLTEQQAWDKISYYEGLLKDLGITNKNRLKLSLFEMFYREG